jgi:protein subunit release factor B
VDTTRSCVAVARQAQQIFFCIKEEEEDRKKKHRKEREKNSSNWSELRNYVPSTYFPYSPSRHQMWKQKKSTCNAERILSHRHTFKGWNPWRRSAAVSRSQVKRNKL